MSIDTLINIIAYAVSIGTMYGKLSTELKSLRKDVEKHNGVIERQYHLETEFEKDKAELKGEIDNLNDKMKIYHHE